MDRLVQWLGLGFAVWGFDFKACGRKGDGGSHACGPEVQVLLLPPERDLQPPKALGDSVQKLLGPNLSATDICTEAFSAASHASDAPSRVELMITAEQELCLTWPERFAGCPSRTLKGKAQLFKDWLAGGNFMDLPDAPGERRGLPCRVLRRCMLEAEGAWTGLAPTPSTRLRSIAMEPRRAKANQEVGATSGDMTRSALRQLNTELPCCHSRRAGVLQESHRATAWEA